MKIIRSILWTFFLIFLCSCRQPATIAYKVVDEQGLPIANAEVFAGYNTGGGWSGRPEKSHTVKGKTNIDGIFLYKSRVIGGVGAKVSKEGYYDTYSKEVNIGERETYKSLKNPLVVFLKKKINPVQMYAKQVSTSVKILEGNVGYDLMAGDFVKPFGYGEVNDFIFHITNDKHSDFNVTFPDKGDGIQPFFVQNRDAQKCGLKSYHNAPLAGYFGSLIGADNGWKEKYKTMGERAWSEEVNYYFRVRSKKGGKALYGKIYGFFRNISLSDPSETHIEFTYYLNPDGTNNVEYSGKSFFPTSCEVGFQNPPGMP